MDFLGECWKSLGLPEQVQFDNAREVVGWGPAAKYLSRVLRLCLRFGVEPLLIPPGQSTTTMAVSRTSMAGFNRVCFSVIILKVGTLQT